MDIVLQAEAPPPRRDTTGGLRVGKSRVLSELVIHAFEEVRQRIESEQQDLADLRKRLLARQRTALARTMLRLLAGENFNGDITRGLVLRAPNIDLLRVQCWLCRG